MLLQNRLIDAIIVRNLRDFEIPGFLGPCQIHGFKVKHSPNFAVGNGTLKIGGRNNIYHWFPGQRGDTDNKQYKGKRRLLESLSVEA